MSRVITTAWEDENIHCKFEDYDGLRFFHVEVMHFSPKLIREWRKNFEIVKEQCIQEGYNYLFSYTQNKKFIKMISKDFEEVSIVEFNNKIYEVIKWELKQSS